MTGMIHHSGDLASLFSLGLALAVGLLIGIERGWQHRKDGAGSRVAGIRTFGILGLIGGACALAPLALAVIMLLSAAVALLIGYFQQRALTPSVSATSALMGLLTLLLGYLAASGQVLPALASAVGASLLLSMREEIHAWLSGLTAAEIQATLRFALLSAVILPLLPDAQMGPLDAWNPRKIWLVVVFVSGLSLAGYIASRKIGEKAGVLATAFTGALVSSTAVTLALARRLRDGSADKGSVTAGIAIASAVMFIRVCVVALVLAPFAAPALAVLLLPASAVAILLALVSFHHARNQSHDGTATLGNPFDIRPALLLALLVAVLSLGVRWMQMHFGDAGITVLLALTGFADVDAAVMALSMLPRGAIGARDAALALAAPVVLNTLLKAGITVAACPDRRGIAAAAPLVIAVATTIVSLAF